MKIRKKSSMCNKGSSPFALPVRVGEQNRCASFDFQGCCGNHVKQSSLYPSSSEHRYHEGIYSN